MIQKNPVDVTSEQIVFLQSPHDGLERNRDDLAEDSSRHIHDSCTDDDPELSTSELADCVQFLDKLWRPGVPSENGGKPDHIGRFVVEVVLGVGGFGIVYRAFDPVMNRQVALKVPRMHSMLSQEHLARFEREARLAGSLDHPNIVPIYETGHAGPICYIAQAYCPGPNLSEWMKRHQGPIPERLCAALVCKLADAVQYSHSKGVLHRDLKPSNVLLTPIDRSNSGAAPEDLPFELRVTDFGIAKLFGDDLQESPTQTETLMIGTPGYMAPEQAGKSGFAIGPGIDIYGLGSILYELLTGLPPFQGAQVAEVLDQVRNAEPVAPRQIRREVSRDLETICLKCLEKNPARRFTTAQDLARELQRYLQGKPIFSRPVGLAERIQQWCRRRPTMAALVTVSFAATLIIVGLLVAQNRHLTKYTNDVEKLNHELAATAKHATEMQRVAEANERQANDGLYASDINRAAAAWRDGDSRVAMELLNRHLPKPGMTDRRGFEWWYLKHQAGRAHKVLLDVGTAVYTLKKSPDHRLMVAAGLDSIVRVFDPETGTISLEIQTGQVEINDVAFSPDGLELASSGDDGTVKVFDLTAKTERLKIKAHPSKAFQLMYTPDGRQIVSCGDRSEIVVIDSKTGALICELKGDRSNDVGMTFDPHLNSFVFTGSDRQIRIWNPIDWTERESIQAAEHVCPVVSSYNKKQDRHLVFAGGGSGAVQTFEFGKSGRFLKQLPAVTFPDCIESLSVSPDGTLMAVGDRAGSIRLLGLDSDGQLIPKDLTSWLAHQGRAYSLSWSDDGTRLISAGSDGKIASWNVAVVLGRSARTLEFLCRMSPAHCRETIHFTEMTNRLLIGFRMPNLRPISPPFVILFDSKGWQEIDSEARFQTDDVVVSPNEQFMAASSTDSELRVYSIAPGFPRFPQSDPIATWECGIGLNAPKFSRDSTRIAVASGRPNEDVDRSQRLVWLLDSPRLEHAEPIPICDARLFAFSPDGSRIAIQDRIGIKLWDIDGHQIVWESAQPDVIEKIDFSPDGRLLATYSDNRMVNVRNVDDGKIRYQLSGHRTRIGAMTFSPDGRTLATLSKHAIKLWHVPTGHELLEFNVSGTNFGGEFLTFDSNGHQLICSGVRDGTEIREIIIFDALRTQ